MATAAEIQILINAQDRSNAVLRQTEANLNRLGKAGTSLVSTFAGIGKAAIGLGVVALAGAGLGAAFVAPIKAASDLGESINKAGVVFGKSTTQVLEFASTSSQALGLSRQAAIETTSAVGNLLTSVGLSRAKAADMSVGFVTLAADLASFNNIAGGAEEVLADLQSGIVGETEPLRKYGIVINETTVAMKAVDLGLAKNVNSVSEAAKVQARYALIMQATVNAQGDFARTSDDLANSVRRITATFATFIADLGGLILPGVKEVVVALGQALPAVLPVLIKALQPAADAFNQLGHSIAEFIKSDQFPVWAQRIGNEISYTVVSLGILVQGFSQAFTAIAQIVITIGTIIQQAMQLLDPTARHSPSLVDNVKSGFDQIGAIIGDLPSRVVPALQAAGAAMELFGAAVGGGLAKAAALANTALMAQIALLGTGAVAAYQAAAAALDGLNTALAEVSAEIEVQEAALKTLEAGLKAIAVAQRAAAEATRQVGQALADARDDLARWQAAILPGTKAFEAAMFAAEQAARRAQLAIVNFKLGGTLDAAVARVNKLRDAWQHAKDMLSQYVNAQLIGTQAASDAAFANEQAQKKLQLQINEGKLAGMDDASLAPLIAELDRLRLLGENIKLKDSLDLDPQRRQLELLGKHTKELTFEEARKGVIRWRAEVDRTEKSLKRAEAAQAAQARILAKLEADLARIRAEQEKAQLEREIDTAPLERAIAALTDTRIEATFEQIAAGITTATARIAELEIAYAAAEATEKRLGAEATAQQALIDSQREKLDALREVEGLLTEQAALYTAQLRDAERAAGALEAAIKKAAAAMGGGAGGGGGITPPKVELPGMPGTGTGGDMGGQEAHEQSPFEKRIAALQIRIGQMLAPLKDFQANLDGVSATLKTMADNGYSAAGAMDTLDTALKPVGDAFDKLKKRYEEGPQLVFADIAAFMGQRIGVSVAANGRAWGVVFADFQKAWTQFTTYVKPTFDAIGTWLSDTVGGAVGTFTTTWTKITDAFTSAKTIYDRDLNATFNALGTWLGETAGSVVKTFTDTWLKVTDAFTSAKTVYDTAVKPTFDAIQTFLETTVGGAVTTAQAAFTSLGDFLGGDFTRSIDGIINGVLKRLFEMIDRILGTINRAIDRLKDLLNLKSGSGAALGEGGGGGGGGGATASRVGAASVTINNTIDARGQNQQIVAAAWGQTLGDQMKTQLVSGVV